MFLSPPNVELTKLRELMVLRIIVAMTEQPNDTPEIQATSSGHFVAEDLQVDDESGFKISVPLKRDFVTTPKLSVTILKKRPHLTSPLDDDRERPKKLRRGSETQLFVFITSSP
jgi:hypothetical protein